MLRVQNKKEQKKKKKKMMTSLLEMNDLMYCSMKLMIVILRV